MSQLVEMMRQGASFSGNERNCVYLNVGDHHEGAGRFACISAASGFDYPDDGRALAAVDWDQDGDLDLWVTNRTAPQVRMMRNNGNAQHGFVALRLQGNGATTNRDAIGARVEIVQHDPTARRLVQTLRAGEGYLGQSTKWLVFGLGTAANVDSAVVQWPGGEVETFSGLEINRHCELIQGTGRATVLPVRNANELALRESDQVVPKTPNEGRVRLVTPVHVPPLRVESLDGSIQSLKFAGDNMRLINLWATWCAPCLTELTDFIEHHDALKSAGVEVLALAVDGLDGAGTSLADVKTVANRLQAPFFIGRATPEMLDGLYTMRDVLMAFSRKPQIPTSFLLDAKGRLIAMYTGPVSVQQLIDDATLPEGDIVVRFLQASPLPGRVINQAPIVDAMLEGEAWIRNLAGLKLAELGQGRLFEEVLKEYAEGLRIKPESIHLRLQAAKLLLEHRRLAEARTYCQEIIELQPKSGEVHSLLGLIALEERDLRAAERHFQDAVKANPNDAVALHNLGNLCDARQDAGAAEENYRRAIAADPYSLASYVSLSMICYRQQRFAEAQQLLEQALVLDPNYIDALTNLGSLLLAQGKLHDAQRRLERAVELSPSHAAATFSLGEVARLLKDRRAALRYYQRALTLANSQGLNDVASASASRLREMTALP